MSDNELEYAGFWVFVGAALIDTILLLIITVPLLLSIYGWKYFDPVPGHFFAGAADVFISWIFPAVATITFWFYLKNL